jgi:hypothetical protein
MVFFLDVTGQKGSGSLTLMIIVIVLGAALLIYHFLESLLVPQKDRSKTRSKTSHF